LLFTLEKRGYVEKYKTGRYRLSGSAFEMAQKLLHRPPLLRKARPVMECLVRKCKEAVYLGLRKNHEVLLLDMFDTLEQVKVISLVGKRFPLLQTAAGLVLAEDMFSPEPSAATRGAAIQYPDHARDMHALGDQIASLAVPLRGEGPTVCGSICLVGPAYRFSSERIEQELLPLLKEAGDVISSRLGHFTRQPSSGNTTLSEPAGLSPAEERSRWDPSVLIL
jgi:DNA-binding IclR family transcriptional regulator